MRYYNGSSSAPSSRIPATMTVNRLRHSRGELVLFTPQNYLVIRRATREHVATVLVLLGLAEAVQQAQVSRTVHEWNGTVTERVDWTLPAPVTVATTRPELGNWPMEWRKNQAEARASVKVDVSPSLATALAAAFGETPPAAPAANAAGDDPLI